jgi:hypothetical protein
VSPTRLISGGRRLDATMAMIIIVFSRALGDDADIETLKTIAMFCGVGLFVSLLFATYGLDLSPGFF